MNYPATELLSLKQVVAELGVSQSSVHQWIGEGRLASFKIGRVRRLQLRLLLN
jgi:excisionase family DNA binding protein